MMHTADMMKAFAPYRGDAIVVPGRGGRYWINLSDNQPLDVAARRPGDGRPCRLRARPGAGAAGQEGRAVRLRGRHPDEPRHAGHDRRAGAAQFLSFPARQRGLRDDRRPAGAERREDRRTTCSRAAAAIRAPTPSPRSAISSAHCRRSWASRGRSSSPARSVPEIENEPIGRRRRWQTRTRDEVVVDLRRALGSG